MCEDGPGSVGEALALLRRALDFLNGADAAGLPEQVQADTLRELERVETAGADLGDLAGLAEQIYQRCRGHDDDGPADAERGVWLGVTLGGAGRLEGDLTPGCSAALSAVLSALGRKAGPEDTRTVGQRRHDALENACRRLLAAGMLPGAGQPAQALVHLTLRELRDLPASSSAEVVWFAARAAQPGWLTGAEAQAAACDVSLAPLVTGHVDQAALDRLIGLALDLHAGTCGGCPVPRAIPACVGPPARRPRQSPDRMSRAGTPDEPEVSPKPLSGRPGLEAARPAPGQLSGPAPPHPPPAPAAHPHTPAVAPPASPAHRLSPARALPARLREDLLRAAADVLSGPGGLAAWLRASHLAGPLAAPGLPLDLPVPLDAGPAQPIIPAHLRRAVVTRHRTCAFPGCTHPAAGCHIHHLIPRSRGGPTTLANLVPLCPFHHLTAIHRWGWTLTLHPDGTTTATSPDRTRIYRSHGPPGQAA